MLWSVSAAESPHVEREWRWALECGTTIVPVLLDQTPLPVPLGTLHAVSLREYVGTSRTGLTLGRFPPVEWMGLGTCLDTVGAIAAALLFVIAAVASFAAIQAHGTVWRTVGWGGLAACGLVGIQLVHYIPLEIRRGALRRRLSRLVVQSLREWGNENLRAANEAG